MLSDEYTACEHKVIICDNQYIGGPMKSRKLPELAYGQNGVSKVRKAPIITNS